MNPNPITASPSNQTLTINGAAFQSGAKVQLIANGSTSTLPASQVTYVSAAKITAVVTVNVSVGSTAGTFGIQVLNPDGQSSAAATLTVVLPTTAPAISGLNPNPMTGSSSSQILTITGTGFVSGAKVTLAAPGSTPVVYQGSQQLIVGSSTQITVLVNVGTLAQTWSVSVTNPNGQSSASTALTVTSGKTSGISITSLTPNPFAASLQMQVLTINGTGFTAATNVQFFAPQTIAGAKIYGVWILSSTQIAVELTLGTTPQTWNVQVVANGENVEPSSANGSISMPWKLEWRRMKQLWNVAILLAGISGAVFAQSRDQFFTASVSGRGGDGKCTIEVNVDDTAIVEITGDKARLVTVTGQPAQWRRFECNQRMPGIPVDFRFRGVDGRGRQQLVRDPAGNRGVAVIRIEDPKGGREGYTFDIEWRGGSDFPPPPPDRDRGRDRDGDRDRRDQATFTVSCSSDDGYRHYCEVDTRQGVRSCAKKVARIAGKVRLGVTTEKEFGWIAAAEPTSKSDAKYLVKKLAQCSRMELTQLRSAQL